MNDQLTSAQISFYRENGFLIIEDFLDKAELDTWRAAVDEAVSLRENNVLPVGSDQLESTSEKNNVFQQRINLWMDHDGVREIMLDSRLGKMAADLAGVDGIRIWQRSGVDKITLGSSYGVAPGQHKVVIRVGKLHKHLGRAGRCDNAERLHVFHAGHAQAQTG